MKYKKNTENSKIKLCEVHTMRSNVKNFKNKTHKNRQLSLLPVSDDQKMDIKSMKFACYNTGKVARNQFYLPWDYNIVEIVGP